MEKRKGKVKMEKEIAEQFLHRFVKIERKTSCFDRPFNLYGVIKEVTDETVLLRTDRLGAIPLDEIISIRETKPLKGGK